MTYLFYNWKFVPFDPLPSPPTLVSIPKKTDSDNNQWCSPVELRVLLNRKCKNTDNRALKFTYSFMIYLVPGYKTHSSVSAYRTHRP